MNHEVPAPDNKTFKKLWSDYKLYESRIEALEDITIKLSDRNAALEKALSDIYHNQEKFTQSIKFDIVRLKTDLEYELKSIKKQTGVQESFTIPMSKKNSFSK